MEKIWWNGSLNVEKDYLWILQPYLSCSAAGLTFHAGYSAGYNSRYTTDTTDPYYYGEPMREIQLSNMDAWNEIYFPTDGSGNGEFAPFILSPSLTIPSGPDDPSDAQLNIQINGTYSQQTQGLRGYTAHLDFELGECSRWYE